MKQKIEEWIRGHPIEAFFLLTIAMSFGLLFPVFLIIRQEDVLGQILFLFLGRIGTYSPVLTGMFVARIIQPGRQRVSLTRRLSVFLPVWFIAVIIHTTSLNLDAEPGTPLIALLVISLPVALLSGLRYLIGVFGRLWRQKDVVDISQTEGEHCLLLGRFADISSHPYRWHGDHECPEWQRMATPSEPRSRPCLYHLH